MSERDPDTTATEAAKTNAPTFAVRAASVEVKSGPDAGRSASIDRPLFVIGTGTTADLRLTDSTMSREHLRIALSADGVRVRDEGSKNGTWLGETRVRDLTLTGDTVLRTGASTLAFRVDTRPLELPMSANACFGEAIGVSACMRHLFATLERVASSDVTVLIEGESGVGKEVLASAIHAQSPRAEGPFVVLDCGAIPAGLVESELFGHERGAFTGASQARKGAFEQASGGTLFLDEVGELPLELQPKLLRVLERREVRPVGSERVRSVDVRVVAATNRRLAEAAQRNEFRPDLFYRLAVVRVTVPPLRDRTEDIVPIAQSFFRRATGRADAELPADFAAMLTAFQWPGNVRELRNAVERYAVLGIRDERELTLPGAQGDGGDVVSLPFHEARRIAVDRFERDYAARALERADGVVVRAAEAAEMGRTSFYRLLHRVGLSRGDDERDE